MYTTTAYMYGHHREDACSCALCVPRVEPGITERFIGDIFASLDIGEIKSVSIRKNSNNMRKAFINLSAWNNTEKSLYIQKRLKQDLPVNVMYQIPWYWKLKLAF